MPNARPTLRLPDPALDQLLRIGQLPIDCVGMTSSRSLLKMRVMSSLSSGLPGQLSPPSSVFRACLRVVEP
jgi:hypothetical protein